MSLPCTLVFFLALAAGRAAAQEPTGPPPSSGSGQGALHVHELLPDLGRIGAQAGLSAGPSWNPYDVGSGFQGGGWLDLPLARAPGGKLSYEILLALSRGESDPLTITDPVAYLANLASGASPAAALVGPPRAPFPVVRSVRTELRFLEISPFGLKYTLTGLDHLRLRPYGAAGLDFVVAITRQTPALDESLEFRGGPPFDDPLIGGLLAQAPELTARGTPTGQGNIEAGFHVGAGMEVRLTRGLSLNLDYRFVRIGGREGRLHAVSGALGFHW